MNQPKVTNNSTQQLKLEPPKVQPAGSNEPTSAITASRKAAQQMLGGVKTASRAQTIMSKIADIFIPIPLSSNPKNLKRDQFTAQGNAGSLLQKQDTIKRFPW